MGPRLWELRKSGGCKGNQDFLGKVYFFKTKLVVSGMVVSEPSRPLKNWIPISNVHCPQRTKMRTGIVTKNNIKTIIHILRLQKRRVIITYTLNEHNSSVFFLRFSASKFPLLVIGILFLFYFLRSAWDGDEKDQIVNLMLMRKMCIYESEFGSWMSEPCDFGTFLSQTLTSDFAREWWNWNWNSN